MNHEERRRLERQQLAGLGHDIPNAKLVGRRLPGVHLTPDQRDLPLDQQVEAIVQAAQEAAEPLPEQAGHVPTIGALATPEGAWGVFCLRCSAEAGEYVYPCKIDPEDWPPKVLVPWLEPDED